jgi:hypothetical protein
MVDLRLPPECDVVGYLYHDPDPAGRGQDMVEVHLPNSIVIDAGWYPEGEPGGRYRIAVHLGSRRLEPYRGTRNIDELARRLEQMAVRYLGFMDTTTVGGCSYSSETEDTQTEWQPPLPGKRCLVFS